MVVKVKTTIQNHKVDLSLLLYEGQNLILGERFFRRVLLFGRQCPEILLLRPRTSAPFLSPSSPCQRSIPRHERQPGLWRRNKT